MFERPLVPGTVIELTEFVSAYELTLAGIAPKDMNNVMATVTYRILPSSWWWKLWHKGQVKLEALAVDPPELGSLAVKTVLPESFIVKRVEAGLGRVVEGGQGA